MISGKDVSWRCLPTLREEIFAGINFRKLGFTEDFAGINFRELSLRKDFTGINFRELSLMGFILN